MALAAAFFVASAVSSSLLEDDVSSLEELDELTLDEPSLEDDAVRGHLGVRLERRAVSRAPNSGVLAISIILYYRGIILI